MNLKETEKETGAFELDESYFGAKRVRDKNGCKSEAFVLHLKKCEVKI